MKKTYSIIGIAALVVIAGAAFFLMSNKKETPSSESTQTASSSSQTNAQTKNYTASEVAAHNTQNDCWTIVNKSVYNITAYVPQHPGGIAEITKICGKDGTSLFEGNREHDATADAQLARLKIGTLSQ
jgi:cytochrome b involved in lipid metabolism